MTSSKDSERLFYEPGASWYWLLAGPVSAAAVLYIQRSNNAPLSLLVPSAFLVLVTGFIAIQVKAARIHTSMELTRDYLRQGTETILVSEIVKVYPEAENSVASGGPLARWQTARALGELVGVPRGRGGIGLKLSNGRTAQAWARKYRHFRDVLTPLIEERAGPFAPDLENDEDDEAQL